MQHVKLIAKILMVIGAINWGLVGLANMDLVAMLLGVGTMAAKVVYILVGLSGVYGLVMIKECLGKSGS